MTQPPHQPDDNQPYEHNDWIIGSNQSAGRPEDTQQLPPHAGGTSGLPYAGAYSQPSSGNPYNQPYQQPSAGGPYQQSQPYDPNQPPAGPPAGGTFGSWQPQPPQPQRRFSDANPLRAAFDFGFNSYATPGLVKIIYILAAIVAALWWIGGGLAALIAGIAARSFGGGGGTVALGVVGLLLGWIPALLWLLFVRIILEASLALVRVADDARHIRTKIE